MTVHWVSYDLKKSGLDCEALIICLTLRDSWAKPLKSSYFVKTSLSAKGLLEGAMEYVDARDSIVIVNVTSDDWATVKMSADGSEWMKAHV